MHSRSPKGNPACWSCSCYEHWEVHMSSVYLACKIPLDSSRSSSAKAHHRSPCSSKGLLHLSRQYLILGTSVSYLLHKIYFFLFHSLLKKPARSPQKCRAKWKVIYLDKLFWILIQCKCYKVMKVFEELNIFKHGYTSTFSFFHDFTSIFCKI